MSGLVCDFTAASPARDKSSAVYAAAGGDTKALVFTHPEFYRHVGVVAPVPDCFIHIDRHPSERLAFSDTHTPVISEAAAATLRDLSMRLMRRAERSL